MIDLPPPIILPDHWIAKRPAIIRVESDHPGRHFPKLLAADERRGMLPGMIPVVSGGAKPLTSLSFISSTSSAGNTTVTLPGTWSPRDVCFLFSYGSGAYVLPTGFTAIFSTSDSGTPVGFSGRILQAGDSTFAGQVSAQWIAIVMRPNGTLTGFSTSVSTYSANWQAQSGTLNSDTISTANVPALVMLGFAATFSIAARRTISPNTMTEVAGANVNQYLHYKVFDKGVSTNAYSYGLSDGGSGQKTVAVGLTFTV